MNKQDASRIVYMIKSAYPSAYAKASAEDMAGVVEIWADAFEDVSFPDVVAALKAYIVSDASGYAPVPGQLRKHITSFDNDRDLSESEAWALVLRAASNGIYGAVEEWEKLPPLVQKSVGSWYVIHEMAQQELTSVDESNFKRTYRTLLLREQEKRMLPPSVRAALEGRAQGELPG